MLVPCRPAPRAGARGGRAVDPLPDRHHRARAREVRGLDEVRVGDLDAAELLLLRSTAIAGSLKRSSQTTSLATSRSACEASSAPAAAASFEPWRAPERLGEARPGRRRGTRAPRSTPRGRPAAARADRARRRASTPSCCCWTRPVELLLQLGRLDPRRRQHVAQLAADALGVARRRPTISVM